ncbi:hypothetical protein LguiB_009888 [Lonicera macranthoides]
MDGPILWWFGRAECEREVETDVKDGVMVMVLEIGEEMERFQRNLKRGEERIARDFYFVQSEEENDNYFREFFKTKVYAAVAIGDNKTNPKWNHTMEYTIAATNVQNPVLDLLIELYINRTRGDKRVGSVSRPTCELFHHAANNTQGGITSLTLPLVTDGKDSKGVVTIEYSFGEEKSAKKLSFVKKLANAGTLMAVKGTIMYTTGVYAPIPIRVFRGLEIICSKATANTIFGEEFLLDVILEIVQNVV